MTGMNEKSNISQSKNGNGVIKGVQPVTIPAIQTQDLTRTYGDLTAVDGLTLTIVPGEIFGFLGHNGAGKTTTISLLTTLLLPTSGSATILGCNIVKQNREVRQHIGYVPENVRLYNDLTVAENLRFFGELSGVHNINGRTEAVLDLLDHPEWRDRRVGTFSKGMRQRVGIAQALLHQPAVLFLDEPASGLDPEGQRAIGELIVRLNREFGITIFMNTHQLSEAAKLCTSIGIMNHGRLVMADRLQSVMQRFPDAPSLEEIYLNVERSGIAMASAHHRRSTPIMSPSLIIARKEFRAAFRNRLFLTITLLFLGLSMLSVYIGSTTKRAEMRIYNETIATLQDQGVTTLPAAPEIHTLTILANLTEYVSIVGAILAVILGYNTLIEEKESGGLKLILSRPVYRDQLLTGKLLGNTAVIAVLLGLVFVFNLILLVVVGGIVPTVAEVARLLTFVLLAFSYMLIFLSMAMLLSIRLSNSATVFLISLVLWTVLSFVIPQMADSFMANSSVVNGISGAVNQIPQDTALSQAINFLSPTWHLRNIGGQLLQSAPGSGALRASTLAGHTLTTLLVLLAPTAVFIAAGFATFSRNETMVLE